MSSSGASSPRSSTFEKIEKRISLNHLLEEANLDRDALVQILKQNKYDHADLDENKIQSIIQKATKAKLDKNTNHNVSTTTNPFAFNNDDDNNNDLKNDDNAPDDIINENETKSHYKIIHDDFFNLRQSMTDLQNKIKEQSNWNAITTKTEHNNRLHRLQQLSQRKKEVMEECQNMEIKFKSDKLKIENSINSVQTMIKEEEEEQENLLLKKIALQQNVSLCNKNLTKLIEEKKKFSEMKDISQFEPIAVFYVLKYLEMNDFISSILCCRAWYYSLNKPCFWRIVQRNIMYKNKLLYLNKKNAQKLKKGELVTSASKLKRINHAVMQLKIEPNSKKFGKKHANPRPDDIYKQCMQQLQKVIAQADQDREELEDRVKAQQGILKFMQASMYGKMHELSELRVRKWILMHSKTSEHSKNKKLLHTKIKELEKKLNKNRLIIENIKENMFEQDKIRHKKLKIQLDLRMVKVGTSSIEIENEVKKLKAQTKKLAQVMVQLRKEIPKRKQEVKKYKNRVDLLQHQYQQYSQQPLP